MVLSGYTRGTGAGARELIGGDKYQLDHARPVLPIETRNIVSERMTVQQNRGMSMRPEHRSFHK